MRAVESLAVGGVCPTCSEGCKNNGYLSGGSVNVDNPTPTLGETVTFAASGVVDNPGTRQVCVNGEPVLVPDGPVGPTYRWELLPPAGGAEQGEGSSKAVLLDACGSWTIRFYANAQRTCKPWPIVVGEKTVITQTAPLLDQLGNLLGLHAECLSLQFPPDRADPNYRIDLTRMGDALKSMTEVPCQPGCATDRGHEVKCAENGGSTFYFCVNGNGQLNWFQATDWAECRCGSGRSHGTPEWSATSLPVSPKPSRITRWRLRSGRQNRRSWRAGV